MTVEESWVAGWRMGAEAMRESAAEVAEQRSRHAWQQAEALEELGVNDEETCEEIAMALEKCGDAITNLPTPEPPQMAMPVRPGRGVEP